MRTYAVYGGLLPACNTVAAVAYLFLLPYQASVIHGRCTKALRAKNVKDTVEWEPKEWWAVFKTEADEVTQLTEDQIAAADEHIVDFLQKHTFEPKIVEAQPFTEVQLEQLNDD